MTDIAGAEEPAGSDKAALDPVTPLVPIAPGAAGVAVPAILAAPDPLDDPALDAEPLTAIDDIDEAHGRRDGAWGDHGDGHVDERAGLMDQVRGALRGLFGPRDR